MKKAECFVRAAIIQLFSFVYVYMVHHQKNIAELKSELKVGQLVQFDFITGVHMSVISYNNLFKLLIDKGIKKTELAKQADISQTTLAKLSKNQYVSMDVLVKICDSLDCSFDAIVEIVRVEKDDNESGGETLEE